MDTARKSIKGLNGNRSFVARRRANYMDAFSLLGMFSLGEGKGNRGGSYNPY
jgi:hypothetical protein